MPRAKGAVEEDVRGAAAVDQSVCSGMWMWMGWITTRGKFGWVLDRSVVGGWVG